MRRLLSCALQNGAGNEGAEETEYYVNECVADAGLETNGDAIGICDQLTEDKLKELPEECDGKNKND